jgi:hypothetical protein
MKLENENLNEAEKPQLNIGAVIGSAFVSIFDRFGVTDYNEHDTIKDAIKSLEYGSDEGLIMDIAVIETSTKKMVWYQKFLGKPECQAKVDKFVKHYL